MSKTKQWAGPRMDVVQYIQVGGPANGAQHGVRAWGKEDTGEHAFAWVHLHTVSGIGADVPELIQ